MDINRQKNLIIVALLVVVVIMGVEIFYLVGQNRRLVTTMQTAQPEYLRLTAGDVVPPLDITDVDGNPQSLSYGPDQPLTIVCWFSPDCDACEDNLYLWNDLYTEVQSDRVRLLGFCACDTGQGRFVVEQHALEYPVLPAVELEIIEAYRGEVVPQTALISPEGVVIAAWPGTITSKRKDAILTTLKDLNP